MAGAAGPYVNCAPRSEWIIAPDFGELFDLISNGTGSFALSGISVTETREERFDFVKPYYGSSGVKLWVLPGEENQVSSINGTKVCIMPGYYLSEALERDYGVVLVTENSAGEGLFGYELPSKALKDGLCEGVILDSGSPGPPGLVEDKALGEIEETPYGIMLAKGNQPLYDALSAGMISTVWGGEDSKLLQWRADSETKPNKFANLLVDSVTGFDIPGFDLDYGSSVVLTGPLAISNVTDVTIIMLDAKSSAANLVGNATLLESDSQWTGFDVEIAKTICASSYFNCVDILVTSKLDERLSLLDTVSNGISISNLSVEQARLNKHLFVQPYYLSSGCAVYVKDGSAAAAGASLPYLKGFTGTACVPEASACIAFLEQADVTMVVVGTVDDAYESVESGVCTGQVRDSGLAIDGYVQATRPELDSEEPLSMAVSGDLPASAYAALSAIVTELLAEREIQNFISNVPGGDKVPVNHLLDLVSASIGDFVVDGETIAAAIGGDDGAPGPEAPPDSASAMLWGAAVAVAAALVAL